MNLYTLKFSKSRTVTCNFVMSVDFNLRFFVVIDVFHLCFFLFILFVFFEKKYHFLSFLKVSPDESIPVENGSANNLDISEESLNLGLLHEHLLKSICADTLTLENWQVINNPCLHKSFIFSSVLSILFFSNIKGMKTYMHFKTLKQGGTLHTLLTSY